MADVRVQNLAGHNLPSGVSFRREAIAARGELADLKLTPQVDLPLNWTVQRRVVGLE